MNKELVSTNIKNRGDELLANRITARNYWSIIDTNNKGFLSISDFYTLLEVS